MNLNINKKDIKRNLQYNCMSKEVTTFLFIMLSVIGLLQFTSALGDIGEVKQGDCIDLYNYCPTCSYVNLTAIQYPDSLEIINLDMEKTGNNYNYSFCDTTTLGDYSYTTCGDKAGVETCEDITFQSTPSGRSGNSNIALIIILIVAIYGVTLWSFYIRNIPLSAVTGMMMTFFGVWIIRNGIVIYRDNLTNYFGYVTIAVGAIIALTALLEWIQDTF